MVACYGDFTPGNFQDLKELYSKAFTVCKIYSTMITFGLDLQFTPFLTCYIWAYTRILF